MATGIASLLSKGIDYLADGQTVEVYMAQVDADSLSSAECDELQALLHQSAHLLKFGQVPVPTPRTKAANRARFLSAAVEQKEASRTVPAGRWFAAPARLWRGLLGAALSIALLLLLGVGAVSASIASLPGSPLYPLKLAAEDARLALAFGPPTQARLYIRFASERGNEMVRLVTVGHDIDETILARMARQWQGAVETAESAGEEVGSTLLEQVIEASSAQGETLRRASAEAASETRPALNEGTAIAEATTRQAREALQNLTRLPIQPTPTPTWTATATPLRSELPVVAPVATPTPTPSATVEAATRSATPESATSVPVPSPSPSPTPSATPLPSATLQPQATDTSIPAPAPSATASPQTPAPSNTPEPTHTLQAVFHLTLQDTPDPAPATHRIHYVICVVNEGPVSLTNVVITDTWSPLECVYYLPFNPEKLTWEIGTVEPQTQSCVHLALNTYSICGGRTVTNDAVMTCDQGTARAVQYTRIIGTPTPDATATMTATLTPTLTSTLTLTPATGTPSS